MFQKDQNENKLFMAFIKYFPVLVLQTVNQKTKFNFFFWQDLMGDDKNPEKFIMHDCLLWNSLKNIPNFFYFKQL